MTREEAIFYLKQVREDYEGKEFVEGKEALDLAIKALEERPKGEWAKGFHEGFGAGSRLAEAFSEDTPYKEAYNKTLEEMKRECKSMTKPMEYLYYGECLGTFEQTFNKHLRETGNETDN